MAGMEKRVETKAIIEKYQFRISIFDGGLKVSQSQMKKYLYFTDCLAKNLLPVDSSPQNLLQSTKSTPTTVTLKYGFCKKLLQYK